MPQHRRILALWFPRLSTDRIARKNGPPDAPLVIAAKAGNAMVVQALEARAERLGLYAGMPLANARAMVQPLAVMAADPRADAALLENIADWCDRFTPLVGLNPPCGLYLDITGVAHLFGGEDAMLTMVCRAIAAQGFAVRAAIAGTTLCAHALARFAHGHIAPPGGESEAVAPLSTTALDPGDKCLRALRHAGLKTVGMVAQRLSSELAERLGGAFVRTLRITCGMQDGPIEPRRPLPDLMAERRFADPIVSADVIAASLQGLATTLAAILERQGRGARMLEAVFFRADGQVSRIGVRMGQPVRDAGVMLRLLRQKLDALADPLDPGFGFDLIRLEAVLAQATRPTAVSFDADANARAQVAFLIDRLAAHFGETRVQRFVPQDTHIPEAAGVAAPAQEQDFDAPWPHIGHDGDPPRRPLRLLEKPEEVFHVMASVPDGPPSRFRWRRAPFEVTRAEGPERIAMEWWRNTGGARDYFRVETGDGQRFWLYRDGPYAPVGAPRWYLHGIFA